MRKMSKNKQNNKKKPEKKKVTNPSASIYLISVR